MASPRRPQRAHAVIDQQCRDGAQRDAGEGEIADVPGEVGDADDQGDGGGHLVDRQRQVDMVGHPDPDAEHADQTVEHDRRAAEDARRDRRDRGADLGAQRQCDRDDPGDPVRGRRVHAGGGHHADVLAVGGGRRAAADSRQDGGDPVGGQRPARQGIGVGSGHLADGFHVADVLGHQGDHGGQEHRQHREVECRRLEPGQTDPGRRSDPGGVDVTEDQRQ